MQLTLAFMLLRPFQERKLQLQTGLTGKSRGKEAVLMPKGPQGSTSHGGCLVRGSLFHQ